MQYILRHLLVHLIVDQKRHEMLTTNKMGSVTICTFVVHRVLQLQLYPRGYGTILCCNRLTCLTSSARIHHSAVLPYSNNADMCVRMYILPGIIHYK